MNENTLFPGRPDYVGPTTGWFGLLHHDTLCEESHDVAGRVAYVTLEKPDHEIAIRLHNMIYLGGCEAAVSLAALITDYWASRHGTHNEAKKDALCLDYRAKKDALCAEILAYIRQHIPDCAWDEKRRALVFPQAVK